MGKREQYIDVIPPFSLDTEWDPADPKEPSGYMQTLVNFYPSNDILRTRFGAGLFIFTATSTP
jgi:hypothetical protein